MVTPEERAAIERRVAELRSCMKALDHLRIHANIPEWAALYEECDALEKQLGDDA
jgi:hypothetical protein